MLNTAHVIGNLGKAPKVETTANGTTYAFLSLANNREWTDRDGHRQSETTWLDVVAFGGLARSLAQLDKGDQVAVNGRLRNKRRDGKIAGLELLAESVDFLRVKAWQQAPAQQAA